MLGENSSSPLWASGGCGSPWHLRVVAVPASLLPCVSLHTSLSLRGHQSLNSGTVLLQYDFFLNSIASLMTPFPRKVVLMGMVALGHIFPEKKTTHTNLVPPACVWNRFTSRHLQCYRCSPGHRRLSPEGAQASWWPPCTCHSPSPPRGQHGLSKTQISVSSGAENQSRATPTPNPATAPCWSWSDTQASCGCFLGPLAHGRRLPTPQHPGLPRVSRPALAGASAWGSLHDPCKPGPFVHPGRLSPVTFSREAICDRLPSGHHAAGPHPVSPHDLPSRTAVPMPASSRSRILVPSVSAPRRAEAQALSFPLWPQGLDRIWHV